MLPFLKGRKCQRVGNHFCTDYTAESPLSEPLLSEFSINWIVLEKYIK